MVWCAACTCYPAAGPATPPSFRATYVKPSVVGRGVRRGLPPRATENSSWRPSWPALCLRRGAGRATLPSAPLQIVGCYTKPPPRAPRVHFTPAATVNEPTAPCAPSGPTRGLVRRRGACWTRLRSGCTSATVSFSGRGRQRHKLPTNNSWRQSAHVQLLRRDGLLDRRRNKPHKLKSMPLRGPAHSAGEGGERTTDATTSPAGVALRTSAFDVGRG